MNQPIVSVIKKFCQKYWPLIALFGLIIGFIISLWLKSAADKKIEPSPVIEQSSLHQIEIGKTQEAELKKTFGNLAKEYYENGQKVIEYPSAYQYYPNKIYLKDQVVFLIKEQIAYQQNLNLNSFINVYGDYNFVRHDRNLGDGYPLYIFLDQGLAVAAHISTNRVMEVWQFPKMNRADFDQTIGISLSTSSSEKF